MTYTHPFIDCPVDVVMIYARPAFVSRPRVVVKSDGWLWAENGPRLDKLERLPQDATLEVAE